MNGFAKAAATNATAARPLMPVTVRCASPHLVRTVSMPIQTV